MVPSLRLTLATFAAVLALAADAPAAWFPAEPIDGPSPDVLAFGDLDIARDGTGGLVYVKRHDGIPHVFLSRFQGGAWQAPERADLGVDLPASDPVIAAGDNHRLLIAWVAGGKLYGTFTQEGPPSALSPAIMLWDGGVGSPVADVGINQTGYIAFTTGGGGGSDVHATRLQGGTWEPVGPPLDINEARPAGNGARARPDVAVSAEGNAVVVWGEDDQTGRRRVYGRRVTGTVLSLAPQEISLDNFEGVLGGDADSPDIEIEEDGSFAWAAFRQDFGGRSRTIARRLLGSQFEPPVAVDGGNPAETPSLSISGRGMGIVASGAVGSNAVVGALVEDDIFGPAAHLGSSGIQPLPAVFASDKAQAAVAWRADAAVLARYREARLPLGAPVPFGDPVALSRPEFGAAATDGTLRMSGSRLGDMAAGFTQGGDLDRRVVVASFDRPPGTLWGLSSENWRRDSTPRLKWYAGANLWGSTKYVVTIDGVEAGTVSDQNTFQVPEPLADGVHVWSTAAFDQRGQTGVNKGSRRLRIDARPPRVRVRITGRRKAGARLRIRVFPRDGRGTGVKSAIVDYGDRTARSARRRTVHAYRRPGRYTLRVRAADRIGNVGVTRVKLRIRR